MRTKEQILSELETINQFLLKGIPDSDITAMLQTLSTIVTYLASSASLVAESGLIFNKAKVVAYNSVAASIGTGKPASIIKDYIGSKCHDEMYCYELAQRLNAALTHGLDSCRTAISAEKSVAYASNFSTTR